MVDIDSNAHGVNSDPSTPDLVIYDVIYGIIGIENETDVKVDDNKSEENVPKNRKVYWVNNWTNKNVDGTAQVVFIRTVKGIEDDLNWLTKDDDVNDIVEVVVANANRVERNFH